MSNKLIKKTDSCRIIARQEKSKEVLLEQLNKTPIVQIACEKIGVARSTYYRWIEDDKEFDNKIKEAIRKGKSLINDMAESKLISAIQNGNTTAIIYWLKNNHKGYRERKPIFQEEMIEPIQLMITRYDPKYYDEHGHSLPDSDDKDDDSMVTAPKLTSGKHIEIETQEDDNDEEDDDDD